MISKLLMCAAAALFLTGAGALAQTTATAKPGARKPAASAQRGLTQNDVQKMWALKAETLLLNQIKLKGLAFEPEEDWVLNQLPTLTGIQLSQMPNAAAELKSRIKPGPDPEAVAAVAPELLNKIKEAAQKRNASDLEPLVHPALSKDKSKLYDLFDVGNYRGHTLGNYAAEPNREVSVQFFQFTSSQVERVHYVYFSNYGGKVVVRAVKSGPEEADRFLHDEEKLAQSKLDLMFRALNDGDDAGVRTLCSDGLYSSIKDWGGDKHPGDRLTRGRRLDQVSVKTSVPLDQKSVRVVTRISYPLNDSRKIEFDADFERIGNDLKVVRIRDTENRVIVVDPNIDNYLNRRFNLPDGPKLNPENIAMTEEDVFMTLAQLQRRVASVLAEHDPQKINDLAQTFIDSDPSGGEGYGIRVAADEILANYDNAAKDAARALAHGGTVYFAVERHAAWQNEPFTIVVLGISKSKIQYQPAPGKGMPEVIELNSVKSVKFDRGGMVGLKTARPFMALTFKGNEGKEKKYNFAALGTMCPASGNLPPNFVQVQVQGVCGDSSPVPGMPFGGGTSPLLVPGDWQQNLTEVLQTLESARSAGR